MNVENFGQKTNYRLTHHFYQYCILSYYIQYVYTYIYFYRKSLNVVAGSNRVFLLTRTIIRGVYNNTTQNIYGEVQHTSLQSITYIPQSPILSSVQPLRGCLRRAPHRSKPPAAAAILYYIQLCCCALCIATLLCIRNIRHYKLQTISWQPSPTFHSESINPNQDNQ